MRATGGPFTWTHNFSGGAPITLDYTIRARWLVNAKGTTNVANSAEQHHITSGHFTAIGALSSAVSAWLDPQKKMYRENPIHEQIEVASMVGDFALYQGKPALHTYMVVGHRDGTAEGGHVIEAIISPTLEVFVTVDPVGLHKKYDPASGLALIEPDGK